MRLLTTFPNTALLLSSLLFVTVSGGRKSSVKSASSSVVSPSTVSITESDHVPMASSPVGSASRAQSRSSSMNVNDQGSNAVYSQPMYSMPFDPSMTADSSIPEASYYDPVAAAPVQVPHHHHHHHAAAAYHQAQAQPVSSAAPHARHAAAAGAAAGSYAAASSATPYATAAAPYHQGYYGGYGYDYPGGYLAQGSHVAKRAHGYGGYGWHPDLEVQTLFFLGIPLIIIPLIFLWPYFLYSLHSRGQGGWGGAGGYGGQYGGGGGYYRSASGDSPDIVSSPVKELKEKTDELTKKVVPKLSKKEKSSKSSSSS